MLSTYLHWWKYLKNTLLINISPILNKQGYPLQIFPRPRYKVQIDIDSILKSSDLVIVRRSEYSREDTFNKLGYLLEDVIHEKDLFGLSMNLLGGKFRSTYIKFVQGKEGAKQWDGKRILYDNYSKLYTIKDVCTPVYFNVKDLHKKQFPYYRESSDKETQKIIKELGLKSVLRGTQNEFSALSNIKHTPNIMNYWHVELELRDAKNAVINTLKAKWQESLAEMALSQLITSNARQSFSFVTEIKRAHYI